MCGICGFTGPADEKLLQAMTDVLAHRGPDDFGYYSDMHISLGHRRLSIIDLETGRQPIWNEDRSVCVVLNGEIYNYVELKKELTAKGHQFYTRSDTEVIVHLYEEMQNDCVRALNGIFAFALWDTKKRQLVLARDRLGVKPLYYHFLNQQLFFASEIKSLLMNKRIARRLDAGSLDEYLSLRYVPGHKTLLQDIYKLPPASIMIYRDSRKSTASYWHIQTEEPQKERRTSEYLEEFGSLFAHAVRLQLMSDVPFGVFISGGVDSGAVVAMMHRYAGCKIKTFTIGFHTDIDEFSSAQRLADYFNTAHQEITVDKKAFRLLPKIVWHLDEPIGDSIIIPIYLLSKEASHSVKMVLTGEGADEVFGSYIHQTTMHFSDVYARYANKWARKLMKRIVQWLPLWALNRCFSYPASLGMIGRERVLTYLEGLGNRQAMYAALGSVFTKQDKDELYSAEFKDSLVGSQAGSGNDFLGILEEKRTGQTLNSLIEFDLQYWLPDYTLSKLDRLTMASSLEGRVPFLDHRLVEFCSQIPLRLKLHGFTTKYLLRKTMEQALPLTIVNSPKRAFYFPFEKCFGKDFEQYVYDLFDPQDVNRRGLFNYKYIKQLLSEYGKKELLRSKQLMSLVVLENWLRIFIDA